MIYIIISNVGLALMTLILYFRYSHFKIISTFKIRDLEKRLNRETSDKEALSSNLANETKNESEQIKQLLKSIEELRKEKEEELKLRLEAERQIEAALQKTQDIQKRINEWKLVQDAVMEDAKNTMLKMNSDLLEKFIKTQKDEAKENRFTVEKSVKNVYLYLDSISKTVEEFKQKNKVIDNKIIDSAPSDGGVLKNISKSHSVVGDSLTKQIISKVIENIKLSGHTENKIYVAASTLNLEQSKLFLCDIGFLKDNVFYAMDFKAARYFQEYKKSKITNKIEAEEILKQRLAKYISYISHSKYKITIGKLMNDINIKYSSIKVVFVVNNQDDIEVLKETNYFEQIQKSGLEIFDLDVITDLVL